MKFMWSKEDRSINIVFPDGRETRYVRRKPEYYALYVSSQLGCNKACRMCHLTQTGQTDFTHVTIDGFMEQISTIDTYVKKNYDKVGGPAPLVHINFMARGEPLANPYLLGGMKELFTKVEEYFKQHNQKVRFNISTIMPLEVNTLNFYEKLIDLKEFNYEIYYSIYSLDPEFRKRWLPKAMDPFKAVLALRNAQLKLGTRITFHHALIKDENDKIGDILDIKALVESSQLEFKFNLVRYNPFSSEQGKESPDLRRENYMTYIRQIATRDGTKVIQRVGKDVYASCGTFIPL